MIQVGLAYIWLQTLKYSETHWSGGHFDVEINQQTSQPAQQRYKATFQVADTTTPSQNPWWGYKAKLGRPRTLYTLQ